MLLTFHSSSDLIVAITTSQVKKLRFPNMRGFMQKPQSWRQYVNLGFRSQNPVLFPEPLLLPLHADIAHGPAAILSSQTNVLEKLEQYLPPWAKNETDRIVWSEWLRFKFQFSLTPLATSGKLLYFPTAFDFPSGKWRSLHCCEASMEWSPWHSLNLAEFFCWTLC